jgi:mono/diheme cytochrome c family protein/peroxiredoxin
MTCPDPCSTLGHDRPVRRIRPLKIAAACGLICAFAAAVSVGRLLHINRFASSPAALVPSISQTATPRDNPAPIDRGEIVFQIHCAKCHGPEGHSDPESMARQRPPPRDFASRPWRFEVTPVSIRRVITEGSPGTAMPAHRAAITEADIEAVVAHVYGLATRGPTVSAPRSPLAVSMAEAGFLVETTPHVAPELTLVDAAGRVRKLADERRRVVLLNFWGLTCEHCLAGMPKLQSLADQWESEGLTVLSVCTDAESATDAQNRVNVVSPDTRVWVDETGVATSRFDVHLLPTICIIDSAGRLVASAHGMQEWDSTAIQTMVKLLCHAE